MINTEITPVPLRRISVGAVETGVIKHENVEVPTFYTGKSAYQSYLDTTEDSPAMTEEEWAKTKTRIHVVDNLPETGNPNEFYAIFE
ncbi:MAG: hypothetical protein EOM44_00635 [Bacteroidia bacterium]|nr:hypothetical protein [Bacteroidia bacterium]